MDKPLVLEIQEFQQKISEVIATSELPIYILKYQIKDLYDEIKMLENNYVQQEIKKYYEAQNQEQNESEENKE